MVPTPTKQKALAPKKLITNRTWDCEYDIYSLLQEKNRVLKSEKSNYFKTLLQDFVCKDPEGGDPDLVQFMDGLYIIVKSRMPHLKDSNIENTAEENGTNDDVMVDPNISISWIM